MEWKKEEERSGGSRNKPPPVMKKDSLDRSLEELLEGEEGS